MGQRMAQLVRETTAAREDGDHGLAAATTAEHCRLALAVDFYLSLGQEIPDLDGQTETRTYDVAPP